MSRYAKSQFLMEFDIGLLSKKANPAHGSSCIGCDVTNRESF